MSTPKELAPKDPAAVSLGRRGGLKGGTKRVPKGFSMMDPAKRLQLAKDAAAKRWNQDNTRKDEQTDPPA